MRRLPFAFARRAAVMSAALLVLFALLSGALRFMSYDSGYFQALRQALNFDDCPAPCYLGIQPGHTSLADAFNRLRRHRWTAAVRANSSDADGSTLEWMEWGWQEDAPPFWRPPGSLSGRAQGSRVDTIHLPTRVTLAELWLAQGSPDSGSAGTRYAVARYGDFFARVPAVCAGFWEREVELLITPHDLFGEPEPPASLWRRVCRPEAG